MTPVGIFVEGDTPEGVSRLSERRTKYSARWLEEIVIEAVRMD